MRPRYLEWPAQPGECVLCKWALPSFCPRFAPGSWPSLSEIRNGVMIYYNIVIIGQQTQIMYPDGRVDRGSLVDKDSATSVLAWLAILSATTALRQGSRLRTRDGGRGQTEQNREQNKTPTTNVTWQTVHSRAWVVNQWSFITLNNYILWLVNDVHNGKITPMMWSSYNFHLRSSADFCLKI